MLTEFDMASSETVVAADLVEALRAPGPAPAGPYVRSLAALPAETTRGPRCGAVESSFARARFAFGAGVAEAPSARLVGCWARRKSVCVWVRG